MNVGKVSCFIALTLYPLALISITCNLLLFFPGWDTKYARDGHISPAVKYMGGLIGGGLLILILAFYIHLTVYLKWCDNRCGMSLTFILSIVGLVGGVYSFMVALIGMGNGPMCKVGDTWSMPYKDSYWTYVFYPDSWGKCDEPKNVVQFNLRLFGTLIAASCVQMLLCAALKKNSSLGCVFGTTTESQARFITAHVGHCTAGIAVLFFSQTDRIRVNLAPCPVPGLCPVISSLQ